ncbi:hypothetical protein HBH56_105310 [Parastagonospora nodorum]|uniref:Uncharacterized protein n=2 Tax=Phaeosphaeria nodorum (strain SN15 / ATCC MYA-4574 / FGSC 10173) TaxID=321614 RepID=Q0UC31_PHANO|nr:hypothetical protein SNOG_10683 [Parastagonospora nodorum SN15]KAH3913605.1 hypothetical protein HBH56_105310 [Parastagonospora nodorum]EAT82077.1 hypothetical protein SNOG_10683 [Parastagonospora nodorum SN15]KAH3929543.1 hypothetical protein HBH54_125100 [Parastagonospora nodorum]KAH3951356.1 hypothetical protein HBH53_059100 [Parastagonospora nodorum]KAH4032343.1 hypothetical protein HBI09_117620 [Parastagonospora nodorum]
MESTANYKVKLGFWTNWSNGKILGATMTTSRQNGGFLIAFLAIFVGMAGKSFWRLGCFTIHCYLSSAEPQDGVYHQRQAILRNSDTAFDGVARLFALMFAWRSGLRAQRSLLRLLPTVIMAFIISAAFGVASVFSSSVTSETLNQVLLEGRRCGLYLTGLPDNITKEQSLSVPYSTERASRFLDYGRQCYVDKTQVDGCNLYTKPRLPLNSERGVKCPFGEDICKIRDDNLLMDTGNLDSLEDLGINIDPQYRFELRFVTTCAPLKTKGYTSDYNDSKQGAVKRYLYGSDANSRQVIDFTYEVPLDHVYQPSDNSTSQNVPRMEYQLGARMATPITEESVENLDIAWEPIDALKKLDADVHILFMSAPGIFYSDPVSDPWFSAQKSMSRVHSGGKEYKFWQQDEPLGVMACTQQVQYCNPKLSEGERCEPLRGLFDKKRSGSLAKTFPSEKALAAVVWADRVWSNTMNLFSDAVFYVGASALRARYSLSGAGSGPLPDNQWQIEAEHLQKGCLASLQDAFVLTAHGVPEALEEFRQPPLANETMPKLICANQRITSNSYSSFNMMGVGLILAIGLLIIMLDLGLAPTLAWWRRHKYGKLQLQDAESGIEEKPGHPLNHTLEWSQTSILQLQRLAHEAAGYGNWSGCDETVPVSHRGELLACLDLSDLKHPKYQTRKTTSISDLEEQGFPSRPQIIEQHYSSLEIPASESGVGDISHSVGNSEEGSEQNEAGSMISVEIENETEADNISHSAVHPGDQSEQSEIGFTTRIGGSATVNTSNGTRQQLIVD